MAGASTFMQLTKSPTFCPSPWTMLNIDQQGHTSPCFSCTKMIGNIKENTILYINSLAPVKEERKEIVEQINDNKVEENKPKTRG